MSVFFLGVSWYTEITAITCLTPNKVLGVQRHRSSMNTECKHHSTPCDPVSLLVFGMLMYNFHKGPRSCTFKISETLFTRQRMLKVRCKQGAGAQEPRDRYPPGSCRSRAGGTARSRGPF